MSTTQAQTPTCPSRVAGRAPRAAALQTARARLAAAVVALVLIASAAAQSVVVHPFGGQDLSLGAAVAERAADALERAGADVYGPEVAPTLVPPLVVPNGFLNPAAFLGEGGIDSLTGARLLRETLGADLAATGRLRLRDAEIVLDLYLSRANGSGAALRLTAAEDAPEVLATRVARAIALRMGTPFPAAVAPFDLTGGFGEYARAVTLVGAGFLVQARDLLRGADDLPPAAGELLADLEAALGDGADGDPVRTAVFALAREDFQPTDTLARFEAFARARPLPAARTWLGVLAASENDAAGAEDAFEAAAEAYPYGVASQASYRQSRDPAAFDPAALLGDARVEANAAALLAASIVAENAGDVDAQKAALARLARAAPFFTYPFEQLSFIAFDEAEALAAAEALAVAVELDPDSDLYWTNLGWAYYLLGFLERSRAASERAIELDPTQYIARYNLGLAHAVRDDLEAAMAQYEEAVRFDPEVDDEAIADLEGATERYPEAFGVHYALAYLYAAEGRRAEAADRYASYLAAAEARGALEEPFAGNARRQVEALRAPPAPLEISEGPSLTLGASRREAGPYRPADPLTPVFELYTPGDALPPSVTVQLAIVGPEGARVAEAEADVSVPAGAIGYVVDDLRIELPADAPAGAYRFEIAAEAQEDRVASAAIPFEVVGEPQALRWLLGRGVIMQQLATGAPLYGPADLARPELLPEVLTAELRASADAAAGAIPEIDEGRFAGLDGGDVFRESTEEDVRAFLDWLYAQGTVDSSFVFVEAYAQWAVDGAPQP